MRVVVGVVAVNRRLALLIEERRGVQTVVDEGRAAILRRVFGVSDKAVGCVGEGTGFPRVIGRSYEAYQFCAVRSAAG